MMTKVGPYKFVFQCDGCSALVQVDVNRRARSITEAPKVAADIMRQINGWLLRNDKRDYCPNCKP